MGKIINEILTGDYPGLIRTIQVFDDNIIEVEFNIPYSNEIGDRFWKHFDDWDIEMSILGKYIKLSEVWVSSISEDEKKRLIMQSNMKLAHDILNNSVRLPDEKLRLQRRKGKGYRMA